MLRVTRSGFYAWCERPPSAHAATDARLRVKRAGGAIRVLLLYGVKERDHRFVEATRRLNVRAQAGPGRKSVFSGNDALRVGELDGVLVANCGNDPSCGVRVAVAKGLVERLRFVLEMIEVGTRGQAAGWHGNLLS